MRRWVPYPHLALALFAMWLLLTQSVSPGQILLGAIVALLGVQAMAALRPDLSSHGAPGTALRLAARVVVDIIRSNLAVARIVLLPRQDRVAGFVRLPLELRHPQGLAVLALIITATPGTCWVQFDRRHGILLVHVLDLIDEAEWVRLIKQRYEAPLLEMFG